MPAGHDISARRIHRKVFLVYNRWFALQLVTMPEIALGFAFHWCGPMLDLYLGPLTIGIGRNAVLTDQHERLRGRCRGFLIGTYPEEAVL